MESSKLALMDGSVDDVPVAKPPAPSAPKPPDVANEAVAAETTADVKEGSMTVATQGAAVAAADGPAAADPAPLA
eukprot:5540487-Lingulodinium_polyedra.AAC.1